MLLSWRVIFLLFLGLQIYLIIGMIAFHFLETANEDVVRRDTRNFKEAILSNFTCLSEQNLERLIATVAYAISNGIDPANNATSPSNWEYHSAFFFSGTVITTIGYGHISPNTLGGQSFCIVYALIGIPIFGILLSALGERFTKFKNNLLEKVYQKLEKKWQQRAFNLFLTIGLGMFFFIIIPAIIFEAVEGWSYRESWYYCFITLTTIGFGDFVAGQNSDIQYPAIYRVMVFYWITFGLVYLAMIIQDISDVFSARVEKMQTKADEAEKKRKESGILACCEPQESDIDAAEVTEEKEKEKSKLSDKKENDTNAPEEEKVPAVAV